jgi:hypothetical protein
MPIATSALTRLRPAAVTMAMARSRDGNARMTSMRRIRTLSLQPPTKPANAPMAVPRTIAKAMAANPIVSDVRVPYTTRL